MKKIILTIILLTAALTTAMAQQSYSYYVKRTVPINWRPDSKDIQRYTVAIHPFHLVNSGLKFDFEYELRQPGEWLQAGIMGYAAPSRYHRNYDYHYGSDYNDRYSPNSGFDGYRHMWGLGVSALFKKMWHSRGWYFSTGLVMEFYRVGRSAYGYQPYQEDGLTFYEGASYIHVKSFFKPTVQFNLGKHFSLSRRCFLDAFVGVSASYSFYKRELSPDYYDREYGYYYYNFQGMNGFARRGLNFNCGFRFGVLLWDKQ